MEFKDRLAEAAKLIAGIHQFVEEEGPPILTKDTIKVSFDIDFIVHCSFSDFQPGNESTQRNLLEFGMWSIRGAS
jgi:hypothetical protein